MSLISRPLVVHWTNRRVIPTAIMPYFLTETIISSLSKLLSFKSVCLCAHSSLFAIYYQKWTQLISFFPRRGGVVPLEKDYSLSSLKDQNDTGAWRLKPLSLQYSKRAKGGPRKLQASQPHLQFWEDYGTAYCRCHHQVSGRKFKFISVFQVYQEVYQV